MSVIDAHPDPKADAAQHVLQIGTGFILSGALHVVVSLDIADKLAGGPKTVEALAAEAGVVADPLYRMLRVLAMVGIFTEVSPRTFGLTPAADILRRDVPGSLHDMVLWAAEPLLRKIHIEGMYTVRTGKPAAEHLLGVPPFEYFATHPDIAACFNNGMTSMSASVIPAVLEAYDFNGIGTLVDIAGGHGEVLRSILAAHPAMRGVLFDVDHVIAGARPRIDAQGLTGRCTAVAGDFFKEVPAGGDAYLMKHIIHDWEDEQAVLILRQIHARLDGRANGRVLLLEAVVPPGNAPHVAKIIDLEMLLTAGGRERTADEFAALFTNAGFEMTRVVPTRSPLSVIEARPV
jgi:hypothetical protein